MNFGNKQLLSEYVGKGANGRNRTARIYTVNESIEIQLFEGVDLINTVNLKSTKDSKTLSEQIANDFVNGNADQYSTGTTFLAEGI